MDLRKLAKGKACHLRIPGCRPGPENETVVLCHLRRGGIAGVGHKPCDWAAMPMCHHCHSIFDGGKSIHSRAQLDADALRGLCQWLDWLHKHGHLTTTETA